MTGFEDTDGPREFVTTRWSVVFKAADVNEPEQLDALTRLCEAYWYPLYFFVRRKGCSSHEAKDLIQGFFCRLLEKNYLKAVDPNKGRFRAFLITALKHFMANEWDKKMAQKRGGQVSHVSLDFEMADNLYARRDCGSLEPESFYDQTWALTLLDRVFDQLQVEYTKKGKAELFEFLKESLLGRNETMKYEEAAAKFGIALGTIKSDAFRMQKRFRKLLRALVEDTVGAEEDIDDELRYLISQLS